MIKLAGCITIAMCRRLEVLNLNLFITFRQFYRTFKYLFYTNTTVNCLYNSTYVQVLDLTQYVIFFYCIYLFSYLFIHCLG